MAPSTHRHGLLASSITHDDRAVLASRLAIVIVNYRTATLTIDCLRSLVPQLIRLTEAQVTIVDNASDDGSVEQIKRAIADIEHHERSLAGRMTLLPVTTNGGFAAGNNRAIEKLLDRPRQQRPDFFLLLNPDTLLRPGALGRLLQVLLDEPAIGIVGSRLEDPDGTPQPSAFRFPNLVAELERNLRFGPFSRLARRHVVSQGVSDHGHPADWVAGACMMIRREVIEQVGMLDEAFFMYYEEVDFCRRAAKAGWQCQYEPSARVVHLVGQASGVDSRQREKRRPSYWFRSRRRYFVKQHGLAYGVVSDLAALTGAALFALRCSLLPGQPKAPERLVRDYCLHSLGGLPLGLGSRPATKRISGATAGDDQRLGPQTLAELVRFVREDWTAHQRDWTRPGFRAVAVCRFGQWRMRVRWKPLRAPLSLLYRALFRRCRNVYGIELPYSVQLGRRVVIEHQGGIVVHGAARIGDDCVLRQGVTLGNRHRDRPDEAPVLGCRVNVGAGAKLLGAIHVGNEAVVGANAVVLDDVPASATVVGVPARRVS